MFFVARRGLKTLALALFTCVFLLSSAHAQVSSEPLKIALIEGLSGANANGGEAVARNILWAVERVNARGGVLLPDGRHRLMLMRYDSKGQTDEALSAFRSAVDDGVRFILQGNSSALAAALIDAVNKHNERDPSRAVIFLNYSAVDPSLTNEKCSFWHFRFDAHADMRMTALMAVLKDDVTVKSVYLIGQDYSFGQSVLKEARRQIAERRPDIHIVAEELHPLGRVKDFLPYANKIKSSGAQAVITGNFSNDLTLLVKASKDVGFTGKFYTFYGNALGAPAAIGEAGISKVLAVAEWLPNASGKASEDFYQSFKSRFPNPSEDYVHLRMTVLVEALVKALESVALPISNLDMVAIAKGLELSSVSLAGQVARMRASDHQIQQPLVVGIMDRKGTPGVKFDSEGSGYGFRVIKTLRPTEVEHETKCVMRRP